MIKYSYILVFFLTLLGLGTVNAKSVDNDFKLGLSYLPQASLPGEKVRTPGHIEILAVDENEAIDLRLVNNKNVTSQLKDGEINAWVGVLDSSTQLPDWVVVNNLNWSASPVAIMRTDTDIKSWQDLRNRTVCISKDNRYIGELEHLYGAIEDIYPTVTDALLALRIGQCDASLQEEDFVAELLSYPEWQKFSNKLEPYKNVNLIELHLAKGFDNQLLNSVFGLDNIHSLVRNQARDIAFEVYLDQTVPDCH